MKLQEEQIKYIKDAFSKMKSKDDFLALLNFSKKLVYRRNTVPFTMKHINYHSNGKAGLKNHLPPWIIESFMPNFCY